VFWRVILATYLRDEQFVNTSINSDLLTQLDLSLRRLILSTPEYNHEAPPQNSDVIIIYTIRFDEKGYRVFNITELLEYFNYAQEIERIILQIETGGSLRSNRASGSYFDLKLDKKQPSFLTVSSDNEAWMNDAFSSTKEIIQKYKNKNGYFRNAWAGLLIQLFGVLIGFMLSLWGATQISPLLEIENSFLISFLLILLIFSNLWTEIGIRLNGIVNYTFPSIRFERDGKDQRHWIYQAIVGGIVVALILFLLNKAFSYMGTALSAFIK
jgi:hypothetical protein